MTVRSQTSVFFLGLSEEYSFVDFGQVDLKPELPIDLALELLNKLLIIIDEKTVSISIEDG